MYSLPKNVDDFQYLIQSTNIDFNVIDISESKIIENKQSVVDIKHPNYSYEFCPTESSASATLQYIGNHLSSKLTKDLNNCKSCELKRLQQGSNSKSLRKNDQFSKSVCKQTLYHSAKLVKWLSCVMSTYLYGEFDCMFLSVV